MLGKYQESLLSPGLRFGPAGAVQRNPHAASRFGTPTPTTATDVKASQYDMDDPFMAPGAQFFLRSSFLSRPAWSVTLPESTYVLHLG